MSDVPLTPISSTTTLGGTTGLEEIEMGAARIQVDDKKIIKPKK